MREEGSSKTNNEKMAVASDNFPKKTQIYYINFEGNFGRNHITPRGLRSDLLNQYVQVSGIVTRMSIVKPRIQTSIHYCEETKRGHVKHYTDNTNLETLANM
jgi:DNA replication licensing factor MCM3